jgi:hypothetical protein
MLFMEIITIYCGDITRTWTQRAGEMWCFTVLHQVVRIITDVLRSVNWSSTVFKTKVLRNFSTCRICFVSAANRSSDLHDDGKEKWNQTTAQERRYAIRLLSLSGNNLLLANSVRNEWYQNCRKVYVSQTLIPHGGRWVGQAVYIARLFQKYPLNTLSDCYEVKQSWRL